jgi:hypothetical protein
MKLRRQQIVVRFLLARFVSVFVRAPHLLLR